MSSVDNFILALLSKCKSLVTLRQIHALVMKTGLDSDSVVAGKLLIHCAVTVSDALEYGRRLFLHFPYPDVFMYNTLIRGFSESDSPRNAFGLFVEMRRESMAPPDSFSFAFLFKATANFKALRIGLQLHRQAVGYGMDNHLFVSTTLISMYADCGCVGSAKKVFEEILDPNVVAWNAVVTACFRCEDLKGAQKMFDQIPVRNLTSWNIMLSGYTKAGKLELARKAFFNMPLKDDVSWSTMIVGFAHNGLFDDAFEFFRELQDLGTGVNEVSLTGVLSVCAMAGAFEFGKLLHGFVEKIGYLHITSVNNALIDAYSKCGNVAMAQLVFVRMPGKKSIVTWTAMIAGLAMQGHGKEAIELFHEMQENGIRPDGIAFISILYACSHAGLIEDGWKYFSCMKCVYGIEPSIEHYGCMVDLCGRAGQLQKAFEFVCQMPISPNAVIWRTLLGACSIHGNLKLAEKVKERLYELDPKDSGDQVLLSNLYAVAGKWKDVAGLRRSMTDQNIKKTPGWSMIEVDKVMYRFVAGEKEGKLKEEANEKLREIMVRLRIEGYVPEVGPVLHDVEQEEKEDSMIRHSEKLAVAFGMARMAEGKTIRVVKNLRTCRDCHGVMKLISKVYRVEIVVRDRSRFHSFKDGSCSCRDYW